jgi:hypothetical protein
MSIDPSSHSSGMIISSYSQIKMMKQKIAITLDRELLSFIDRQAQGNRSDYLNSLVTQERRKILAAETIAALQADSQDPEYQAEITEWDRLAGDGIDA